MGIEETVGGAVDPVIEIEIEGEAGHVNIREEASHVIGTGGGVGHVTREGGADQKREEAGGM